MTVRPLSLVGILNRQLGRLALLAVAADILLPLGLVVYAQLAGQPYWRMFWATRCDPVTWLSSLQLLAIAVAAYANHQLCKVLRHRGEFMPRHEWIFLFFAAGFSFLALDERFELHEAIRDRVFQPRGLLTEVPLLRPGDVALLGYLALGIAASVLLVPKLREHRFAVPLFVAALTLTVAVVLVDSLDEAITERWGDGQFWTSAFEEVGELWAQLFFLLAFLAVLQSRLRRLGQSPHDMTSVS